MSKQIETLDIDGFKLEARIDENIIIEDDSGQAKDGFSVTVSNPSDGKVFDTYKFDHSYDTTTALAEIAEELEEFFAQDEPTEEEKAEAFARFLEKYGD